MTTHPCKDRNGNLPVSLENTFGDVLVIDTHPVHNTHDNNLVPNNG